MPKYKADKWHHELQTNLSQPLEFQEQGLTSDLAFASITRIHSLGRAVFIVEWGGVGIAQYWRYVASRTDEARWRPVLTFTPKVVATFDCTGTDPCVQHAKLMARCHPSAYYRRSFANYANRRAHTNGFFFDGVTKRLAHPDTYTIWYTKAIATP